MIESEVAKNITIKRDVRIMFTQLGGYIIRHGKRTSHVEHKDEITDIYHSSYVIENKALLMLDGNDAVIRLFGEGSAIRENKQDIIFTGTLDDERFIELSKRIIGG